MLFWHCNIIELGIIDVDCLVPKETDINFTLLCAAAQKGSRKKRVSDTAAMNAPAYPPPYNPYTSAVPGNMPPNMMNMYDDRNAVPPPYASTPGKTSNMVECEGKQHPLLA
jgi:hypothetical protein